VSFRWVSPRKILGAGVKNRTETVQVATPPNLREKLIEADNGFLSRITRIFSTRNDFSQEVSRGFIVDRKNMLLLTLRENPILNTTKTGDN
jgi:hypothetical protein